MGKPLYLTGILLGVCSILQAQKLDSTLDKISSLPDRLFGKIENKTSSLEKRLEHETEKFIARMEKKEMRLRKKLMAQDSAKAIALFNGGSQQEYETLLQKLKKDSAIVFHSMGTEYLPYADSLQGMLRFLNKNQHLLNSSKAIPGEIQQSLLQLQQLQVKMQDADQIKQFIASRKQQIQQYLAQFAKLPPGVSEIYNNYKRELYYYSDQIRQYRQILNDPDKMMKTALQLLNKIPAFEDFMHKNSFLAAIFSIPGDYGTPEGLVGLQTRDQVLSIIQGQVGSGGPNATSMLQSSLQSANQDITTLQNKLSKLGAGSGDMDMPNFKPNNQKTKTFLERLEYGTDLQTQTGSYYFPITTDLGFSLGYKISDKNVVGIGASYKVGWGKDYQHINVSTQGAGFRSFVDIQAKKTFYFSGGFEYNYQQPTVNGAMQMNMSTWQKSGLIGLSKIVSMNTKIFKKSKVQLLWDFLSYEQIPVTPPFKFRVGFNF
jgi:hypothetical protein